MPKQIATAVASMRENIRPAMADQIFQNVKGGMRPVEFIFAFVEEMVHNLHHAETLTAIVPHLFRHQALISFVL
jgi:hypothetical protein